MLCQVNEVREMKIEIKQPVALRLEVVETDDHVPSMRVQAQIVVEQFQHACRYDGTFWIECANWDGFVQSLRALGTEGVALRDMSGCFMLALQRNDERLSLVVEFAKSDVGSSRQMKFVFKSAIDDALLSKIKDEFLEFPAWW
jgi:hypothetical protein